MSIVITICNNLGVLALTRALHLTPGLILFTPGEQLFRYQVAPVVVKFTNCEHNPAHRVDNLHIHAKMSYAAKCSPSMPRNPVPKGVPPKFYKL